MPLNDVRGVPLGTASAEAAALYERALHHLVAFYGDPLANLEALIAADPGWGLAHIVKANQLLTATEPALLPQTRAALKAAARLMSANTNASERERERDHLHASQLALAGRWRDACAAWDRILQRHPRDLLALITAHLFDFYRGDARMLRARVARVRPEWDEADPLYPYVLGMHAFGLEECNLYPEAEAVGREALAREPRNPWAVHAVAHVMEMQGRYQEGAEWLRSRADVWAPDNGLAGHNWWHAALFALESLDTDAALALYDAQIGGAPAINLQWLDCASLLWRVQLLGADIGTRWATLAQVWADPVGHAGFYAFNDAHALLALIGSGEMERAQTLFAAAAAAVHTQTQTPPQAQADATSQSRVNDNDNDNDNDDGNDDATPPPDNRAMAVEVGLPLMDGLLAYAQGDMRKVAARLHPLRTVAHHFGGSHAQRDLIDQTLLAACAARGGDKVLGRLLLNERRLAKPVTPLTQHWLLRMAA